MKLLLSIALIISTSIQAKTWLGKEKALVVLLEWPNVEATKTKEDVEKTFFGEGSLSLREFFLESSVGRFDFSGEVMSWRKASKNFTVEKGCNMKEILQEAKNAFLKDVDISEFDSDNNGKIDHFFVIHSGRIPHDRVGPSCTFTKDEVADRSIVFQNGGVGTKGSDIAIGFYLHEAGHGYFGLPDLYGSHYRGRYGIGMWGMMGLGAWGVHNQTTTEDLFRYPAHFEPKSKEIIGWGNFTQIKKTQKNVVIRPVELTGDIIKVKKDYYLEYRSAHGFSKKHHGHGLLVWKGYSIIQADGRDDINNGKNLGRRPLPPITENFGDDSDPFPGSENITQYVDQRAGISLENIREENGVIIVDIIVNNENLMIPEKESLFLVDRLLANPLNHL